MMRRVMVNCLLMLLVAVIGVGCRSAQSDLVIEHSVMAQRGITGVWHYDGASVEAKGSTVLSKVAKPIAKSKLTKKLNQAYKKLKLSKKSTQLTLNADGTFAMRLVGPEIHGRYDYDVADGKLTLRWHGLPVTARVKRDSKHLHVLFDADRLLHVLQLASGLSSNKTLQSIALLAENYSDVQLGFSFK